MRVRILIAILLLAVGGGAVAFVLFQGTGSGNAASADYLTGQVATANVTIQVAATGNLQAAATYDLAFGQAPQLASSTSTSSSSANGGNGGSGGSTPLVQSVKVQVGQTVKKGDLLATEDSASAKLSLSNAQASLSAAQERLATDQVGPTGVAVQAARLSVTQAQEQLSQARQNQSDTEAQNALSLQQAQAAVTQAEQKLTADKAANADATTISQDEAAVSQAQQQLASTQVKVTASDHQAAAQVSSAELSLSNAENSYATKTQATPASQIASDQAAVASAQAQVDAAQTALAYTTLTAPADGTITAVDVQAGFPAPGGTALQLVADGLQVSAQVSETDVTKLQVGQAATVAITALGADVDGLVSSIGEVSSSGSNSVVTYPVTVTLSAPPSNLRIGMSADVTITVAQADGVLAVPTAALRGTTGSYSVLVMGADGSTQAVPVGVGLVGDSLSQVTSGLQAGETVVTGINATQLQSSTGTAGGFGGGGGVFRLGGGANGGRGPTRGAGGGN